LGPFKSLCQFWNGNVFLNFNKNVHIANFHETSLQNIFVQPWENFISQLHFQLNLKFGQNSAAAFSYFLYFLKQFCKTFERIAKKIGENGKTNHLF
jgi:hypothetical protein